MQSALRYEMLMCCCLPGSRLKMTYGICVGVTLNTKFSNQTENVNMYLYTVNCIYGTRVFYVNDVAIIL